MRSWLVEHFDVVAASWLIVLVFAWSIFLAYMSASRPSSWTGPLIGGVDWNAYVVAAPASSSAPTTTGAQP